MTRTIALTAAVLAMLAAPALAQKNQPDDGSSSGASGGSGWGSGSSGGGAPLCGMPAGAVGWIGGDEAGSDIASSGGPLGQGVTIQGTEPTFLAFTSSGEGMLRLESRALGPGDTVLSLVDETGIEIGFDDDGGGDYNSRLETYVGPGTYCLAVRGYENAAFDAEIQVGRMEHEAITTGMTGPGAIQACTPDTPADSFSGEALDAVLGRDESIAFGVVPADQRYFRFDLTAPTQMLIRAENEAADPVLQLFDGRGQLIAENDDHRNLNSALQILDPLPAGSYCVAVGALSDETMVIELSVSPFDEAAYLREAYDMGEISPPLDGDHPIDRMGTLQTSLSGDFAVGPEAVRWVAFTLDEHSLVVIHGIGTGGIDPIVSLFGPAGQMLASNDDASPGNPDSMLAWELSPGTYLVALDLFDGSPPGTMRVLLDRWVRAQ